MIEWKACDAVERIPGRLSGMWVIRGTRIAVETVLANAADGFSAREISQMFSGLGEDEARRVIEFANQAAHADFA